MRCQASGKRVKARSAAADALIGGPGALGVESPVFDQHDEHFLGIMAAQMGVQLELLEASLIRTGVNGRLTQISWAEFASPL